MSFSGAGVLLQPLSTTVALRAYRDSLVALEADSQSLGRGAGKGKHFGADA